MFKQFLYKLYLLTLALPLVFILIIIGWKKETISANAQVCGLTPDLGFRIRFYHSAALDLLRFLHGHYGSPITFRSQDAAKLERLRSGPSLFLTAHFHNWELMGAWMVRQGVPLLSAARPMVDALSQSLLARLRDRLGQKVLFGDVPRRALRHLQGGGCFGLLWDQRVPVSKTRAPLFGRTLAMDPLPRFLSRNADVPVYFGVLLPGGGFRILQIAAPSSSSFASQASSSSPLPSSPSSVLSPSGLTPEVPRLPACASTQGPREMSGKVVGSEEINRLGRRYHRILECLVRAHPTSWYGLAHRRFLKSPTE